MKRFYTNAAIGSDPGGHTVLLDDRPIRTPGRRLLALPTPALPTAAWCTPMPRGCGRCC